MRYSLLLLTGLLAMACSDRERDNPLDPGNPVTHGAPTGFLAVADRRDVTLTWDPMIVDDLIGYNIYRSVAGGPLQVDTTAAPDSARYTEKGLQYDTRYLYAVQAVTVYDSSRLSAPDSVIPGLYNFWIADYYNSRVWRISYDGAHVLGREYFTSPDAVVCQPGEDLVWVTDYWGKAVYCMDRHFTDSGRVDLTGRPIAMVADTTAGVFVLQIAPDAIVQANTAGASIINNKLPVELSLDASFALDPVSASVWLGTATGSGEGSVYRLHPLEPDSSWELVADIPYPNEVAADPLAGGCWVATDSGIVRIDAAGYSESYLAGHQVLDISINPKNGDCYYIGVSHVDGQWQTGYLIYHSDYQVRPILGNEYPYLTVIQVLPDEGQAGFLVSQISTGRILRFDREGNLIGRLEGFGSFLEFAIE